MLQHIFSPQSTKQSTQSSRCDGRELQVAIQGPAEQQARSGLKAHPGR